MRASRSNAEQELWRGYLDPAAVVVEDLTCRRVDLKMRELVLWVQYMEPFEKTVYLAEKMDKHNVPFAVALRALNLPPERSVK